MTSISNEKLSAGRLQLSRFFQIMTRPDGSFVSANDLFKFKFEPDVQGDHPAYNFRQSLSPGYEDQYQQAIESCFQRSNVPVRLDHDLPGEPGFSIYWEVTGISTDKEHPYLQWTGIALEEITEKKTADQLERSELFFKALIADALDGMLLVNEAGLISFASASVTNILAYEPEFLVGKNCFDFVHPEDKELAFGAFMDEVNQEPIRKFIGVRLMQKSGEWRWCMVRGHNLLFNQAVGKILIYFCDDSYRRGIEADLIESRERFLHLIQHLDIGVIVCDEVGQILLCNPASLEVFRLGEQAMLEKNVFSTGFQVFDEKGNELPLDDYPAIIAIRTKSVVRNTILGIRGHNKDETTWLQVNAQPVLQADGDLKHVICSFLDITEQRSLARQLELQQQQKQKQLLQATIDGQERERSDISRELHDNISQHLTTTRLYMEVALERADEQLLEMVSQAHKGLMYISNEIRQLSQSLAPPELRDIGLIESIRDLCDQVRNLHPYEVVFDYDQFMEEIIPDSMKLMFFRIIQEQVNNIIRHAGARAIAIMLRTDDREVCLTVSDDGQGFDTALVKKGLGLTNIFNRVSLFDGKVDMLTSPGKGCHLMVIVPLK